MAPEKTPKFETKKEIKAIAWTPESSKPDPEALAQREKSRKAFLEFVNAPGDEIEKYEAISKAIVQASKELKRPEDEVWKILFPEIDGLSYSNIDLSDKKNSVFAINYKIKNLNLDYFYAMGIYRDNKGKEITPLFLNTLKKIAEHYSKRGDIGFLTYCDGYMHLPFIKKTVEDIVKKHIAIGGASITDDEIAVFKMEAYAEELLLQIADGKYAERILSSCSRFNDRPYAKKVILKAISNVEPERLVFYTEKLKDYSYALEYIRNSAYKNIDEGYSERVLIEITALKNTGILGVKDMFYLGRVSMMEEIIEKALDALSKTHPENLLLHLGPFEKSSHKKEYIKIGIEALLAKSEDVIQYYYLYKDEPYAQSVLEKSGQARPGDVLKYFRELENRGGSHQPLIDKALARCMTENPLEAMRYLEARIEIKIKNKIHLETIDGLKTQAFTAAKEYLRRNPKEIGEINWQTYSPEQRTELVDIAVFVNPNAFFSLQPIKIKACEIPLSQKAQKIQNIVRLAYNTLVIDRNVPLLTNCIVQDGMPIEEANNLAQYPDKLFKEVMRLSTVPNVMAKQLIEEWLSAEATRHVNTMNDLHESKDPEIRFAIIKDNTSSEIYSHMVYGEAEVFTSTFNGMYTRMMEKVKNEGKSGYQLIEGVNFTHFRTFIKLCARYNRLKEFLGTMGEDKQKEIVDHFTSNIETAQNPLEEAVTIADTFASIKDPDLLKIIQDKLRTEFVRVQSKDNKEGKKLYGLLAGMFGESAIIDQAWYKEMGEKYKLDDITHIESKDLFDSNKINTQQYFFYNDADGKSSYESYLGNYRGKNNWKIEDKKTYIIISGMGNGRRVEMYANKPEHEDATKDIEKVFEEKKIEKIVVVHRGHSYHAKDTIAHLTNRAKIVVLGSCGGYTNVVGVLDKAPQSHILATKGTGTMTVNDPILLMLNEQILSGKNIDWQTFWYKAEEKLGNNPNFASYIPPHRNLGIAFLKAYRQIHE